MQTTINSAPRRIAARIRGPGTEPLKLSARDVAVTDSDLGWIAVVYQSDTLRQLSFGHRTASEAFAAVEPEAISDYFPASTTGYITGTREPNGSLAERLAVRLRAYAAGEPEDFLDVQLDDQRFTPFQRMVVKHCRAIPRGQTLSYQQIAALAGSPHAARAVGNVMRTNRFPLIVPCHRVVGANGGLGGYSAPDGLAMKRRLLAMESC